MSASPPDPSVRRLRLARILLATPVGRRADELALDQGCDLRALAADLDALRQAGWTVEERPGDGVARYRVAHPAQYAELREDTTRARARAVMSDGAAWRVRDVAEALGLDPSERRVLGIAVCEWAKDGRAERVGRGRYRLVPGATWAPNVTDVRDRVIRALEGGPLHHRDLMARAAVDRLQIERLVKAGLLVRPRPGWLALDVAHVAGGKS